MEVVIGFSSVVVGMRFGVCLPQFVTALLRACSSDRFHYIRGGYV